MSVVPMKRIRICGLKKNRKQILELLQRQGVVEIRDAGRDGKVFRRTDTSTAQATFAKNAELAGQALEVLDKYSDKPKEPMLLLSGRRQISLQEYDSFVGRRDEIMQTAYDLTCYAKQLAENAAELPKLTIAQSALQPWLSLDVPMDFRGTKETSALIGSLPVKAELDTVYAGIAANAPDIIGVDVSVVSQSDEQTCLFIVCAKQDTDAVEAALRKMNFARAPSSHLVPAEENNRIADQLKALEQSDAGTKEKIAAHTADRNSLRFMVDYFTMRKEKYAVIARLRQSGWTFILDGYIPEPAANGLEQMLESQFDCVVEFSDTKKKDDVPVMLKNNGFAAPVESIVESYSMPAPGELDPSTSVAVFYYFLFGVMLGDAGYGILMVIATSVLLKKFKNMEVGTKRFLQLFFFCGIGATAAGFLFGSFFGDAVNVIAKTFFNRPDIAFNPILFDPVSAPIKMLVFSFAVGILQLTLGLLMKFANCMKSKDYLGCIYDSVFWLLLIYGLIVYALTMPMLTNMFGIDQLPAQAGKIGSYAAIVGAVGIILTSGRESKNWLKRILKGLYGLYGITGYLSDMLSYSRLLALGLASSIIAIVVNKMGSMIGANVPGVIIFIVVFLFGHILNFAINAMGAYVHSNRLTFVEFFGKFYSGGSRSFAPFSQHTKYYKVKEDHTL